MNLKDHLIYYIYIAIPCKTKSKLKSKWKLLTVTKFRARERRYSVNAKDEKKIHIWHGSMYRPHYELKYFLKEHFYFHMRFHEIFMTKFAIKAFETDPLFLQLSKHKFGHQFFIKFTFFVLPVENLKIFCQFCISKW